MPPNNDRVASASRVLQDKVLRVNLHADASSGGGTGDGLQASNISHLPEQLGWVNAFAHIVYVKLTEIKRRRQRGKRERFGAHEETEWPAAAKLCEVDGQVGRPSCPELIMR